MTLHSADESTKSVLLAMSKQLEERAKQYDDNKFHPSVKRRTLNMLLVAAKLRTLAGSRAVRVLLDYME